MRMTTMKSAVALLSLGLMLACVQGQADPLPANDTLAALSPADTPTALPATSAAPNASSSPADTPTDTPTATSAAPTSPSDTSATATTAAPTSPAAPSAAPAASPAASPTSPSDTPATATSAAPTSPAAPSAAPAAAPAAPTSPSDTPTTIPTAAPTSAAPLALPAAPPAAPTSAASLAPSAASHAPTAGTPAPSPPAHIPAAAPTSPPPAPGASVLPPGKEDKIPDRPSGTTQVLGLTQAHGPPNAEEPVSAAPGSGRTSQPPAGPDGAGPPVVSLAPVGTPTKTPDVGLSTKGKTNTNQIPDKVTAAPGTLDVTKRTNTEVKTFSKTFSFPSNEVHEGEVEKDLAELCARLRADMDPGNCILHWTLQDQEVKLGSVELSGKVKDSVANQYLADIRKDKSPSKPADKTTLIAILASCGALLAMIIGLGIYATHHRKPYHENQQHLTEELHTVENGYHDNPTLEVMEAQPEMQEKKTPLRCSEFNDSWIVPMETVAKEGLPEEEDTHL